MTARTSIEGIKRLAKRMRKEEPMQHSIALDRAARAAGFENFGHARNSLAAETAGGE